ncbi:DNA repair protein SWI5 homolog [Ischnura elegans]|uniref:DNA repair protein SWI5 homolog n=1 Tax=Ischnura elegans TaxID=197161 RepID=UPI001ED880A2|nr:DNA repair protein SWI5 homolog [Ischnura elegans]
MASAGDNPSVSNTSPKEENEDEVEEFKEMLVEIEEWSKKEHELDEEIKSLKDALNKEPVVTDKDIMEELHKYNDIKDAAQVVIGSLARFEGVSVTELHKRYNLEMSDA